MTDRPEDGELSRRQFLVASAVSAALAKTASAQPGSPPVAALSPARPIPREGELLLHWTVNGQPQQVVIDPQLSLLEVLRESHGLTSVRRGCEDGSCGSCTVLVDGKRVPSCLLWAALCQGKAITTVEGLSPDGELSPIQAAFIRHKASDCGFCTPGQVVAAHAILHEPWGPDEDSMQRSLCGQQCACGRRPQIAAAIAAVRSQRG